jgi:hypothetical protein
MDNRARRLAMPRRRRVAGLSARNAAFTPWQRSRAVVALLIVAALAGLHELSLARALGDITVFQQLPLLDTAPGAPYPGQDVQSLLTNQPNPPTSQVVSDDFELSTTAPLTSISWWGAAQQSPDPHFFSVDISENVPASGNVPSHPGANVTSVPFAEPGWGIGINPPLYNATGVFNPGETQALFERYDATFPMPIVLQPNTVYWLTIEALDVTLSENGLNWAWHTRDYTIPNSAAPGDTLVGTVGGLPVYSFGAPAVVGTLTSLNYAPGVDGPAGINAFGMGMAFALHAAPEPSTFALAAFGGLALLAWRWRRSVRSWT